MKKIIFMLLFISSVSSANVGLVLSGGGAKGLAHVGVLKVLDKAGIKIDYVVGTSMGCIIGGLYAAGYSGEELEKLVLTEDWATLFDDKPVREYIPMYEKDEGERYVGNFNLSADKSFLPIGIISGHKIYTLLSHLTWEYEGIRDFRLFPIPVMCVATDLVKGDAVLLDKGNLAEVMRASMSIPTIFTPIELDNRLLVDGGVVNNLPVSEAKKIGADFVIAVDAAGAAYTKEEIDSFFKVMEQAVSLNSYKERQKERKAANVLIKIGTNKYGITDFGEAKALIAMGEKAAETYLPVLNRLPKEKKKNRTERKDVHYNVTSVRVEGLNKVSYDFITSSLGFSIPRNVSQADIEIAMEKIYGTQFFESVIYDIEPSFRGEYELVIRVKERATSIFRFGFNYSSYTKASLLLNTTFKNTFTGDSRLSFDFNLSENPGFRGQFYMYSSKKPGLGFRSEVLFNKFNISTFQNGGTQANYRFSYYALSLNLETNFSNYMLLGVGIDKEFTTADPMGISNPSVKKYDEFLTFKGFFKLDTLDSLSYPKKGIKLDADFKYATDWLPLQYGISHKAFERISFDGTFALPISKRFSIQADTFLGGTNTDSVPYEYLFYFGGFRANYRWFFPFVGLDYMSVSGPNALVLGGSLQFEAFKNIYLIFKTNVGKLANEFKDVFSMNNDLVGVGCTLGWDSPIGPIDLTLMKEIKQKNMLIGSISIGYWF